MEFHFSNEEYVIYTMEILPASWKFPKTPKTECKHCSAMQQTSNLILQMAKHYISLNNKDAKNVFLRKHAPK
jgi:hypothetical protein